MERSGILDKGLNLEKTLDFACGLAKRAGKLLLESSDKIKIVKYKSRLDVATNVDLASEKLILEAIEKEYPNHNILSEEQGESHKNSTYTWVIDPLDGTKEYIRGIPLYNVSLCLKEENDAILAVVYRPAENQLFSALKGKDSFLNQRKIKVSSYEKLSDSFIFCFIPFFSPAKEDEFDRAWAKLGRLTKKIYRLRSLSDSHVACSWVGMGGCEAFVNLINSPKSWDIEAGLLIAQEAGAKISDLAGRPISDNFENGIIVSNGKIHNALLEVLNES